MKRPNIILFLADQLRYDALGCYGNKDIRTPNIDSIALNGSTFENQYIQNPVCSPSRCSIITGRYPKNHGTRDNGIPLRDEEITIAEVLKESGYLTAAIGKMHFTPQFILKEDEQDDWPEDKYGFDVIHTTCDIKSGEYLNWLKENNLDDYNKEIESIASRDLSGPPQLFKNYINKEFHQTNWIANKTIEVLEDCSADKPFFIMCSFVDPHHPFNPPEPYDKMYDINKLASPINKINELKDKPPHFEMNLRGVGYSNERYEYKKLNDTDWKKIKSAYYGMISLIDDNIGRVLDKIREKNIENDTLILFTSDHGELLGDHGLLFKGPFHYDSLIKAPMIIKWPGIVPSGSRYSQITEHVDIMPTILEYAGIRPPYGVQGISMASILRGDKGSGREYAMTEFNCYDWGMSIKTITGKRYKLTYYAGEEYGELYDRYTDPNEFVNLWDNQDYKELKSMLIKKLIDRIIETEDTLPIRIGKY